MAILCFFIITELNVINCTILCKTPVWSQFCVKLHYGLWVNLYFFTMCIYKHCFLPMLLVSAVKCCTKMPCPLPRNHYCCSLPSPVCLPHLLICTCLISSPIACPPSSVLCWCFLFFFLCIFSYFCDMLHFFVIHMFCIFFLSLCQTSFSTCFLNLLACFFIGCHFELYKFGYIAVSCNSTCCVYWFHMRQFCVIVTVGPSWDLLI